MDRLPKLLYQLGFQFLISEVQGVADKQKFPHPLNIKIFGNIFPIVIDFLDQLEARLKHLDHGA